MCATHGSALHNLQEEKLLKYGFYIITFAQLYRRFSIEMRRNYEGVGWTLDWLRMHYEFQVDEKVHNTA